MDLNYGPDGGLLIQRRPEPTDPLAAAERVAGALRGEPVRAVDGTGLDIRSDLGTLNMSDVPVAMIEIGNMRNAGDARRMTSVKGRARYANAIVQGIRTYLRR